MNEFGSFVKDVVDKKIRREVEQERKLKEVKERALRSAATFEKFARDVAAPLLISARDGLLENGFAAEVKLTSSVLALLDQEILSDLELSIMPDPERTLRKASFTVSYFHGTVQVVQSHDRRKSQLERELSDYSDAEKLGDDVRGFIRTVLESGT